MWPVQQVAHEGFTAHAHAFLDCRAPGNQPLPDSLQVLFCTTAHASSAATPLLLWPHCFALPTLPFYAFLHTLACSLSACTILAGLYTLWSSLPHQNLKAHCTTVFGDAILCSAAIAYLGPFPALRRQELLDKWLALCKGFQEPLGPDDVARALKQTEISVTMLPKSPLLSIRSPFSLLSLLSSESEQFQWDRDLKPQAKTARLAGLLLRSRSHYFSCRWPLLLDPNNQALIWLNPLPLEDTRYLAPGPTEGRGKARDDKHSALWVSELPNTLSHV